MMDTVVQRRQTAFRLNENLLQELKTRASQCNRSLNNFVESLLMQAVFNTPNKETADAIEESKSGKYAGVLDMSNFESFLDSIN